jgi:hypothetical protein
MHFWIDKRSSYGIGHNRPGMAGGGPSSYQHHRRDHRSRSKSIVTPQIAIRPHPTSSHLPKLHHNRNRHVEGDHRTTSTTAAALPSTTESSPQISMHLNQQHIPVIHSVYPRNELSVNHVVESSESSRSNGIINHWLPIQIICGICILLAISLVVLKLYYDKSLTGLQFLFFASVSLVFLICTTFSCLIKMRKTHLMLRQRIQNEIFTETVIEPIRLQTYDDDGSPPPYNVAINLPEKPRINQHSSTPPPSYEKINII